MKPNTISRQRILAQQKKLNSQKLSYLHASPLADDIYTWHFTFQGPQNTQFHQGIYHGVIILPYQYPFKPPDMVFLNKNGRFQVNTKICLTITQYHPQQWNSAWTIRTMLEAVISLFGQNVQGVGSLTSSVDVRKFLAKSSHSYVCQKCGPIKQLIVPRGPCQIIKIQSLKKQQQIVKIERKLSEANRNKQPTALSKLIPSIPKQINQQNNIIVNNKTKQQINFFQKRQTKEKIKQQQKLQNIKKQKQKLVQIKQDKNNSDNICEQIKIIQLNHLQKHTNFLGTAQKIANNIQILNRVKNSIKWIT